MMAMLLWPHLLLDQTVVRNAPMPHFRPHVDRTPLLTNYLTCDKDKKVKAKGWARSLGACSNLVLVQKAPTGIECLPSDYQALPS